MSAANLKPQPSLTSCSREPAALFERFDRLNHPLSQELVERVFRSERATLQLLEQHAIMDPLAYSRTCVYQGRHFEALVLSWLPGQRSPIHNHRGSLCGILVLQGTVSEIVFTPTKAGFLAPHALHSWSSGDVTVSRDLDTHMIANLDATPLVTLHVYSPALTTMEVFELDDTIFKDYSSLSARRGRADRSLPHTP